MTGATQPEKAFYRLKLRESMALFYGLPRVIPFRFEESVEPGRTPGVDLRSVALCLGDFAGGTDRPPPDLAPFLEAWPEIEKLERYLAVSNFTFAERVAMDLLDRRPGLPCALFGLGVASSRLGRWESAAGALEDLLAACPGHADGLLELGLALAFLGRRKGALLTLDRLSALHEDRGEIYRSRVESGDRDSLAARRDVVLRIAVAERSDGPDLALRLVQQLLEGFPAEGPVYRLAARVFGSCRDPARARAAAEKAVRLDPRSAAAHHILAGMALESGDLMEAERSALRARTLAPDWPAPAATLARTLRASGRPDQAASLLARTIEAHPEEEALRKLEAQCLLEAGRSGAACRALRAIALESDFDPVAHFNLGRGLEAHGDQAGAEAAYRAAIDRAPRFAEAREALALLRYHRGSVGEARAGLERLIRELPESPFGYRGRGDLALDHAPEEAARYYALAVEKRENLVCAGLHYLSGLRALVERDYPEAARQFRAAVRADARHHRSWCNLGVAAFHLRDLEEAIFSMEEAAGRAPDEPGYHRNLAAFYDAAFWRHPFRNLRYLRLARRARKRESALGKIKGGR